MPEIGDRISFTPSAYMQPRDEDKPRMEYPSKVKGTIVYINEPHRYFLAEYNVWGYKAYECFKF